MSISHAMRKFHEGNELIEMFKKGDVTPEAMNIYMAHAANQTKLLAIEIAAHKLASTEKSATNNLKKAGFISTASIPITQKIDEMFPCPAHGECNITRTDCLDYSGSENHIDACQKCDQFSETRKQLRP